MSKGVRGGQKFAAVTYEWVAEQSGLKVSSVQSYGAKGVFDRDDLDSTLAFINLRRLRRGLPMLGDPRTKKAPAKH